MMDDDPDGARRPTMTQVRNDASGSRPETLGQRLHRFVRPPGVRLPQPINPALLEHERERAEARQNRAADAITAFSGSMLFVYIHVVWFACWIGLGVERYPFGLLTMIVSLEAIFLSTFVMISQNRADAKRQVIADEQWRTVKEEGKQNVELLRLSNQILTLTQEVRGMANAFRDQDDSANLRKEIRALKAPPAKPPE
jgi:uncharacterized membrane protein